MVSFFPLMNALISISPFHKILTRIIVYFMSVINGIWLSMLSMFDDAVSIVYLLILCLFNLSVTMNTAEENENLMMELEIDKKNLLKETEFP